ncbi:MAG: gephyrin-like molybdotransferase Glp [Thermodesulfobacteriota bacterium]
MKTFFKVKSVQEVLDLLDGFSALEPETVDLAAAAGRVLAEDVAAEADLPDFPRATMDGYAVRARDTYGASEGLPGLFEVVGEVAMGERPGFSVGSGQTARVWTGGMMPEGSDAVVMIEYSRRVDERTVELARPVAPFENVVRPGEDVRRGQVLLARGRRLRAQEVGLLAALGRERLLVVRVPRVAVISTGDEVVPVSQNPGPGQVRDVNTYTLSALVAEAGGTALSLGLVRDDLAELRRKTAQGLEQADVVLISGGSSVGVRDFTVAAFESCEGAEVLVHGVSVSPGKPLVMARRGNQSLWGLPGHTVSAMITCDLFVRPLLARLSGEERRRSWRPPVLAALARPVPSVHGRQDYVRVRLERTPAGIVAHPLLGQSGLISTMVRADGLVCIGLNDEGLPRGAVVEVILFE